MGVEGKEENPWKKWKILFGLTFKVNLAKINVIQVFIPLGSVALQAGGCTKPFCNSIY